MAKATKLKTSAVDAPVSQAEAEKLLDEIGNLQDQIGSIEAAMNAELRTTKDAFEKEAQPLNEEISAKFHALHIYAEANRSVLLKGKSKTVKLSTGEISWRTTPPSVRIAKKEVVIETLKRLEMYDLIRSKDDINKDAILADPERVEGIKGISINQREEFVAKPYKSQIEKAETVKAAA